MGCVCGKSKAVRKAEVLYKEAISDPAIAKQSEDPVPNERIEKPAEVLKSDPPSKAKSKKKPVSSMKRSEDSMSQNQEVIERANLLVIEQPKIEADKPNKEENVLKGSVLEPKEKEERIGQSIKGSKESGGNHPVLSSVGRTPKYGEVSEKKPVKKSNFEFVERNLLESFNREEDLYFEVFDPEVLDFHDSLLNLKSKEKSLSVYSSFNDWAKMIQKVSVPADKLSESLGGGRSVPDAIQEVFRMVLMLRERNWYEEVVQLYKERNSAKFSQNMFAMNFDRKIVHIQEHFKWLVSAIAHFSFNPTNPIGATNFPPQALQTKLRSKSNSNISNPNPLLRSNYLPEEIDVPQKMPKSVLFDPELRAPEGESTAGTSKGRIRKYLPEKGEKAWFEGFVWKGVYLKAFSRVEGKKAKAELNALKDVAIEYLQTETSFRFDSGTSAKPEASFLEGLANPKLKFLNFLLPLVTLVETPSFMLLGTPIIINRKHGAEETRISDPARFFKRSIYLNSLEAGNLRFQISSSEENSTVIQTPNSSSVWGSSSSLNAVLTNVRNLRPRHDPVYLMYLVNQDPNTNIVYFDPPDSGELDLNSLKLLIGYNAFRSVDFSALLPPSASPKSSFQSNGKMSGFSGLYPETLMLDLIRFEHLGWKLQMIYSPNVKATSFPALVNERATDMLFYSELDPGKKIKVFGNVLVFAANSNEFCPILSPMIGDPDTLSFFLRKSEEKPRIEIKAGNPPGKPSLRVSETHFQESQLIAGLSSGIEQIAQKLDFSDEVLNPSSLKELFHQNGVNLRFAWIVYSKLKSPKAKAFLGCDLLCRGLKNTLDSEIHARIKAFRAGKSPDYGEILSEALFKALIVRKLSLLFLGESKLKEENAFFKELMIALSYSLMRILGYTNKLLQENELYVLLSTQLLKELLALASTESSLFINFVQHHFKVAVDYDLLNTLRTDKYHFLLSTKSRPPLSLKDFISINYSCRSYLSLRERAYLILIRQSPPKQQRTNQELVLPSILYKVRPANNNFLSENPNNSIFNATISLDSQLRARYAVPDIEVLNDWVLCLETICNGLQCFEGENSVLLEAYILQILETLFLEQDEEQCKIILEKLVSYLNSSLFCVPEIVVVVHTLLGIIYESKALVECEQNYMMALLTLHKLYGDPRGRGAIGVPWELFVTWRLSIITRLQGKTHDAEYVEELYDSSIMNLKRNKLNNFAFRHYIYDSPFKPYENSFNSNKYVYSPTKKSVMTSEIRSLLKENSKNLNSPSPFEAPDNSQGLPGFLTHWTKHLRYDETTSKIEVLGQSLARNEETFGWILRNLMVLTPSGILWQTSSLKSFFLTLMQSVYTSSSTVSSLSNYSMKQGNIKDSNAMSQSNEGGNNLLNQTPKNLKNPKKSKNTGPGLSNLVQIFERESSTIAKKELAGVAFVWGQNVEGQLGVIIDGEEDQNNWNPNFDKKLKITNPRLLIPLKNTIVKTVACGYTHTMAITVNLNVLAWGSNKSNQLGLGPNTPGNVTIPTQIPKLENIMQVSCGHEHTVALDTHGSVFSWGQGEGGLLGHSDTKSLSSPKLIESLRNVLIDSICCGGLHTLALAKNGLVYAWGRGEGGQLGLSFNLLTNEDGNLYLTTPKRVRTNLEGVIVKQVACGDAHSLALAQNGRVFGWGYTNSGQLGLGFTGDTLEGNPQFNSIQIREPVLIESLNGLNISKIYAGSTFSMFLSEKKELYSCGINDYNQLGIERSSMKGANMVLDNYRNPSSNAVFSECPIPKKLDCFQQVPVLGVSCGENHSIAMTVVENKYYMLFAWGMHKHQQLGLGDIGMTSSPPKPITYLQDMVFYSIGCGAYHTIALAGYPIENIDKDKLTIKFLEKYDSKWNLSYYDLKDNYSNVMEFAFSNLENITPSDEGKIDNPKSIKTVN